MASVATLLQRERDPRVRVRVIATYVDDPRSRRLAVGVRGMLASVGLILTGRVDVVHVHLAHKGSVVRKAAPLIAARLVRIPSVVHAHSYNFGAWFDALSEPARRVVRWALRADRWILLGDSLVDQYARRLQVPDGRMLVLRNPADTGGEPVPTLTAGSPDKVRMVFLGRHGERKGSYDLVRAVAALDAGVRAQVAIVAAGDGEVEQVQAAAASAGVTDVLQVRGWVEADERDALLDDAELFVLPSREEALPMAMLEAMAHGLVPVVTPVGGIPEVITDGVNGVFVDPGDAPGLAGALTALVRDHERRATLGGAARRQAARYGTRQWFETLVGVWLELNDAHDAQQARSARRR